MIKEIEEFLQKPFEPRDKSIGHYELRLRDNSGHRTIWTRIIYNRTQPYGAALALTIDSHNLMALDVRYEGSNAVFDSLGIGVADLECGDILLYRTDKKGWGWTHSGTIGSNRKEVYNLLDQGFFELSALQQQIDAIKTAEAFIGQIISYINNPSSFESSISPSIRPILVKR